MMIRNTIIFAAALSLLGCTSMRPMDASQIDLSQHITRNDHLVIYERTGRIVDMTFIEVDGNRIRGRLTDGSQGPISVDAADIEKMEIEKIDGVRTTLAVVGGAIIIVPAILIAALFGVMAQ